MAGLQALMPGLVAEGGPAGTGMLASRVGTMWLGASEAASADLRGAEAVAASVWAPRLPCGSEGCQQHGHDRAAALHRAGGRFEGSHVWVEDGDRPIHAGLRPVALPLGEAVRRQQEVLAFKRAFACPTEVLVPAGRHDPEQCAPIGAPLCAERSGAHESRGAK